VRNSSSTAIGEQGCRLLRSFPLAPDDEAYQSTADHKVINLDQHNEREMDCPMYE